VGGDGTSAGPAVRALLSLLERLAGRLAVVLVIEDLHWADRSTRDLLGFLAGNSRNASVLLLVTFGSDEMDRGGSRRRLPAALSHRDGVRNLDLGRLVPRRGRSAAGGILGDPPEPVETGGWRGMRVSRLWRNPGARSLRQEVREGLRFVFTNRYLRAFAGEAATFNLFSTALTTVFCCTQRVTRG